MMRLGTRVWGLGKLLVLIGALGATFLLFFGISIRVALRAQDVEVPALTGRPIDQAAATLTGLGLGVRIDETQRSDEKIPAGHVMQQDPPAGAQARRQRRVRVWLSSGPRTATVPSLAGQSERTAQIRLQQDGLELATISEFRSSDHEIETVVAQDPPSPSRAPRVSILVNRGVPAFSYLMPDLTGMEGARAAEALGGHGFRVNIVTTPLTPGAQPGTVIRQRPNAGFPVSAADPVSIEVSR
jgi:serine/threonine-protein kinase